MIKKLLIVLILNITFLTSMAQEKVVTGKVTDPTGTPIPGVNITLKGTLRGTSTDSNGQFKISVTEGTLVFSFIGYKEKEIEIGNQTDITVAMEEDVISLSEVVVIGYGSQKKKDVTMAIVNLDETAIKDRPMVSAVEALQGKAAGVQVVQPSGKPGGDIAVLVRGATSINAGNDPLYVVDGVWTRDIKGLNPSDIASLTVLKDASATAIYGASAASGVVLITTKRGKENTSVVRLNTYFGFSKLRKTVETLSTLQYRALMTEIGFTPDPTATSYTNWSDEVFGTGNNQNYQLSLSGGDKKNQYMASVGYLKNTGMVQPAQFDRYSVRFNTDNQVSSWLKFSSNLNLVRSKTVNANDNAGSDRGGIILAVLNTPPFLGKYKKDGSGQFDTNPFQASWENPWANMFGPQQSSINNRVIGNISLEAKIYKGLTHKILAGGDFQNEEYEYYLDPFRTNYGRSSHGRGISNKNNVYFGQLENVLNYTTNFNKHNLTATLGNTLQKERRTFAYIEGTDFPDDVSLTTINVANTIVTASTSITESSIASFFGRVTYDFDGKYLLTASSRFDGSSKLAKVWQPLPAVSVGWRISQEPFMKNFTFLNDLKLRIGWGKTGNVNGISDYNRYGLVSYFRRTPTSPLSGPGFRQITYGNPDLKWETTNQTNVGFDISVLQARITLTVDAYLKTTKDLLLNVDLGGSVDPNHILTNGGELENKGLEIAVNSVNMEGNINWTTNFNLSFNRNKIVSFGLYNTPQFLGRFDNNFLPVIIARPGTSLGSFYGYVADGVDADTGDLKYKDLNNNGIFDPGDRTIIGSAQPKFTFGLTNNLSYKSFDLNIFMQGSYGNDIYNANRIALEGMFDSKNQSTAVLRRWTPTNKSTDIPRAGNVANVRNSTRFIEDGSYLRVKAVTLNYNFSQNLLKRLRLTKLSVYATGQNLFTLTKYTGFDPEVNSFGKSATEMGIDYGTYPQARTIIFGLNIEL